METLRGRITQNAPLPLAEGRRLLTDFEDRLDAAWLWDTYKVPHTPGSGKTLLPRVLRFLFTHLTWPAFGPRPRTGNTRCPTPAFPHLFPLLPPSHRDAIHA